MAVYLTNSFSLNMLPDNFEGKIYIMRNLPVKLVKAILGDSFVNAVGHQGTIELINSLLNLNLTVNRVSIKLDYNDIVIITQLKIRLEEGQVLSSYEIYNLYMEGKIQFDLVKVVYQ